MRVSRFVVALGLVLAASLSAGSAEPVPSSPARLSGHADGRCGWDMELDVAPSLPTPEDAIVVTARGAWSDSCTPGYHSHELVGDVIRLDATVDYPPGTACLTVITPWRIVVDVGTLPAGNYQVDLYITDMLNQLPAALCASRQFEVARQWPRRYLPLVARGDWEPTTGNW
jgi:hypothetical protein